MRRLASVVPLCSGLLAFSCALDFTEKSPDDAGVEPDDHTDVIIDESLDGTDGSDSTPVDVVPEDAPCTESLSLKIIEKEVTGCQSSIHGTALVWTSSEYLFLFAQDDTGGYTENLDLVRFSDSGDLIDSVDDIAGAGNDASWPSMAWNGSEAGVVWMGTSSSGSGPHFGRMSSTGMFLGSSPMLVTETGSSSGQPDIAWSGSEYLLVWPDRRTGSDEIYVTRIGATGTKLISDVHVSSCVGNCIAPRASWGDTGFIVTWYDWSDPVKEIHVTNISPLGEPGAQSRISTEAGTADHLDIAWNGNHHGLTWVQEGETTYDPRYVMFLRVSDAGAVVGSEIELHTSTYLRDSTIVWTGTEYVVSWRETSSVYPYDAMRVTSAGIVLDLPVRVAWIGNSFPLVKAVWTGAVIGYAWVEDGTVRYGSLEYVCE